MKRLSSIIQIMLSSNVALIAVAVTMVIAGGAILLLFSEFSSAIAQDQASGQTQVASGQAKTSSGMGLGLLAAALSTGLAAVGAGIAVSGVGAAAMGAIAEKPEIMGRSLLFVGLAEGIAIYGLIMSIMILGKL
jgi:V/A-type H+/Na+-transporting ATPase subunit K